jgi:hypothetical protein
VSIIAIGVAFSQTQWALPRGFARIRGKEKAPTTKLSGLFSLGRYKYKKVKKNQGLFKVAVLTGFPSRTRHSEGTKRPAGWIPPPFSRRNDVNI